MKSRIEEFPELVSLLVAFVDEAIDGPTFGEALYGRPEFETLLADGMEPDEPGTWNGYDFYTYLLTAFGPQGEQHYVRWSIGRWLERHGVRTSKMLGGVADGDADSDPELDLDDVDGLDPALEMAWLYGVNVALAGPSEDEARHRRQRLLALSKLTMTTAS